MPEAVQRRLGWIFALAYAGVLGRACWCDAVAERIWDHEQVNISLGLWSTRLLIGVLAVSPISRALREPRLKRLRRPLGLGAVIFAAIHAVHYVVYIGAWPNQLGYILQRAYLVIGILALVLLSPLAATSFDGAVRRLGPQRWRWIHRLVYLAAPVSIAHELMAWSPMFGEPGLHAVLVAGLLIVRLRPQARAGGAARERLASPAGETVRPADPGRRGVAPGPPAAAPY